MRKSALGENFMGFVSQSVETRCGKHQDLPRLFNLAFAPVLLSGVLGLLLLAGCRRQGPAPGLAAPPQGIPVRLAPVEVTTLQESSEFVGTLEAKRSVVLQTEIEGRVNQIFVESGDRVVAGSAIAQLRPQRRQAELKSAIASITAARAAFNNAELELQALQAEAKAAQAELDLQIKELERTTSLTLEGALAEREVDRVTRDRDRAKASLEAVQKRILAARSNLEQRAALFQQAKADAEAVREQLQETKIVAPFTGTIGDVPVKVGDFVDQGDTLTTITQNQSLDLRLPIPLERESELRLGLQVQIFDPQNAPLATGQIRFIAPTVSADSQSILAKASFDNPTGRLRDGQFVRAKLIWNQRPRAISIPSTAILFQGENRFVYQVQAGEPPTVKRQAVQTGLVERDRTEIRQGLQPGDQIVTSGLQKLADGAPIVPIGDAQ